MWASSKIVGKLLENHVSNKNICLDRWEKKFLISRIISAIFKRGVKFVAYKTYRERRDYSRLFQLNQGCTWCSNNLRCLIQTWLLSLDKYCVVTRFIDSSLFPVSARENFSGLSGWCLMVSRTFLINRCTCCKQGYSLFLVDKLIRQLLTQNWIKGQ